MPRGGQNAIPVNIHKLKGTYQPCRHDGRDQAPSLPPKAPECPAALSAAEKAQFQRIVDILTPIEVLSEGDYIIVAMVAKLYAKMLNEPDDFRPSDYGQLRSGLHDLGLTPTSRGKLKILSNRVEKEEKNPFADL